MNVAHASTTSLDPRTVAPRVAAPGTHPDALVAVLGWLVRPRHTAAALRRAVATTGDVHEVAASMADVAGQPRGEVARGVADILTTWVSLGVRAAIVGDTAYPDRLADGWPELGPPPLLAWRGTAPGAVPGVAIVGARRPSGYGTAVASWLAEAVTAAGVQVLSGGAVGIDAAAHRAALEGPGGTTIVLGCGHAVDYPRAHARTGGLFDQAVEHGGSVLSELLPHERPCAGNVRARNRIVAALADVVVVVEGGPRSGSLVTAAAAADWGRPVLAVPGDVRAPGSVAPHRLLAEGAGPCTSPSDVLEHVGTPVTTVQDASMGASAPTGSVLPDPVRRLLEEAWPRPVRTDTLAEQAGVSAAQLLASLTRASIAGEVGRGPDGIVLRRAPTGR